MDRAQSERRKRLFRLLLLAPCVLAAAAAAWTFQTPPAARAARRAFSEGRYADARAQAEAWLRQSPRSAEAHLLKARCALELGLVDETKRESQRAKELGIPQEELDLYRAIIDAHQGRLLEAEPILRHAYESKSAPDIQVDEALALVYLQTYQLRRAGAVLDRWARDKPYDARPYLWRAEIDFRSEGQSSALLYDYREALKRDPSLAKAQFGLAETLRKEHQNAEADAEYTAYLALKPDDPAGYVGAGRNALELGNAEDAARFLDRAVALDPKNAEAYKLKADIALRRNDDHGALAQLDQAIRLDPDDLQARYTRGMVLRRLGRAEEAKAEQDHANRLREDLNRLTELKQRLNNRPNDLDLQIQITQWMFDHGHDEGGVQWAIKIVKDKPNHPRANRLLATYYDRVGNKGLANFYRLRAGPDGNGN